MLRNFFTLYTLAAFIVGGLTWGWLVATLKGARGKTASA